MKLRRIAPAGALLLALAAALPAQLPPEMEVDRWLLQAQEDLEAEEFVEAALGFKNAREIAGKHEIELPQEVDYLQARAWLEVESYSPAIECVTRYLTNAGRDGEHYRAALLLLNRAEEEKAVAEAEAARYRAEKKRVLDAVARMEFVSVPAGTFHRGEGKYVQSMTISEGFEIGKYEVTQEQWEAVMGTRASFFGGCPPCPVETVSWRDTRAFVNQLNRFWLDDVDARYSYDLPTSAEWEYAARAGATEEYPWNVDWDMDARVRDTAPLDALAWHQGNSGERPHPVGGKEPNAYGLHDMHGNVREWVRDWSGRGDGDPPRPLTDPKGPLSGTYKEMCGCDWSDSYHMCRFTVCGVTIGDPDWGSKTVGFRVLRRRR